MDYPTLQNKLIMPEYGRNIQRMVAHAVTIEDREERARCVRTIIHTMGNLFPYLRDVNDFKHKLWDHLAIMSDFRLDIDFPFDKPKPESFHTRPEPIPYSRSRIKYPHYGRMVEEMIAKVIGMEEGEQKEQALLSVANQMKKNFVLWNKDVVDDRKILEDLHELSGGLLHLDPERFRLLSSRDILYKKNALPNNNRTPANNSNNNQQRRRR